MQTVALALRTNVITFAKEAATRGLVPNTQGNVSVRDPQSGLIAITPHDLPYEGITPDDLVIALISGGGSALLSLPAEGISVEEKKSEEQSEDNQA